MYWANLLLLGLLLLAWYRAQGVGLLKQDAPPDIDKGSGEALGVLSTWWSIGFIFAVQIDTVIAPRVKPFSGL
jgi:hypothetical protein